MTDAKLKIVEEANDSKPDLSLVERSAVTNDILRRALERVRNEVSTELLPSAHHTHHSSFSSHSNGW